MQKIKKKLDYKKLRYNYQYLSEEKQEEQEKQKPTKDDYKTLLNRLLMKKKI